MHFIKTIIEIPSLEVMRDTGILGATSIVQIWICFSQIQNGLLETLSLAVIEDDDTEPVRRIIDIAGRAHGIEDQIIILSTARDEDIDGGNVIPHETQLWPITFLQDKYRPEGLQKHRDCDGYLDCYEKPSHGEGSVFLSLGRYGEFYSQGEVKPVESQCGNSEERGEVVRITFPVGHEPIIISGL